jgi:hypothetical protein
MLSPLILSLVASYQSPTPVPPVTIKRTPIKGQKLVFQSRGNVEVGGQSATVTSRETKIITDVKPDGTFTTESTESDLTVNETPAVAPAEVTTAVYRTSGELISITTGNGIEGRSRTTAITQIYFPTKPMSPGDTWIYSSKKDETLGIVPFTATFKYVGLENVGAFRTWKITEDVLESEGTTPASVHIVAYLDVTDGSVVQATSELNNLPAPGGGVLKGNMVVKRRPSDDK